MKQILIALDDKEYRKLKRKKGERTWREFILNINGGKNEN